MSFRHRQLGWSWDVLTTRTGGMGQKTLPSMCIRCECMVGSQLINKMTGRNGQKGFDLMSFSLPKEGEVENAEQKEAREIIEALLEWGNVPVPCPY